MWLFSLAYWGEILSLSAAFFWAVAVILFRKSGETVPPVGLNLFKNLLALFLFLPTFAFLGETLAVRASIGDYLLLIFSGAIGIGVCDTLFFKSLNLIGAGLAAIVSCLYSPFIIGLSVFFLRETMNKTQVFGFLLILLAVLTISRQKAKKTLIRRELVLGIILGVLAMALNAVGVVIMKPLLSRFSLLWVIQVRLLAGCLILGLFLFFHSDRQHIISAAKSLKNWRFMLPGSFLGAYFTMLIWIGGMKYTQASIASALNQTGTIFVFILAAVFLREPVNLIRIIGILMAFMGAALVSLG